MPGKVILLLPAFLALLCTSQAQLNKPAETIATQYKKADRYFNSSSPTTVTDSLAFACFNQVIAQIQRVASPQYDSLLFQSWLKKGILLDVANNNNDAKAAFSQPHRLPNAALPWAILCSLNPLFMPAPIILTSTILIRPITTL